LEGGPENRDFLGPEMAMDEDKKSVVTESLTSMRANENSLKLAILTKGEK
jgi:hypothetical protein